MSNEKKGGAAFQTKTGEVNGMTLLDYFAAKAMLVVTSEMQETVPASFWDWIKMLLVTFLHLRFLEVNFKKVNGIDELIAKNSYELAASMISERKNYIP